MDQAESQQFLVIINEAGQSASMWEAGEAMGLERHQTEALATELMAQGHLEMVSLSGKVRLTQSGQDLLDAASPSPATSGGGLASLVADLKAAGAAGLSGAAAADLTADVACLAAQLERSKPLGEVVQACLKAVRQALSGSPQPEAQDLAKRVGELIA
jgi:hypothetical protein